MAIPFIAIPLAHASGGWIAANIGAGGASYIAGTLSASWIGAFIAGNSVLAGSLAGIGIAGGAIAGFGTEMGIAVGIIAAPSILPAAAAGAGIAAVGAGGAALIIRKHMKRINEERVAGGLEAISIRQLIAEIKEHKRG